MDKNVIEWATKLAKDNLECGEKDAEAAGYDCGKNGPNETNCHFRLFARPELTRAWERGKARAEKKKAP